MYRKITSDLDLFRKNSKIDIQFVAEKALSLLGVKFTNSYLKKQLEQHPNFPSLLSLSDLFEHYNIKATAGEFEDKNEILNYNTPHISFTEIDKNSGFSLITKIESNKVYFQNIISQKKTTEISLNEHLSKWSGIALFFEKSKVSSEPNYFRNQVFEIFNNSKWILLSTMTIFSVLIFSFSISSSLYIGLFIEYIGLKFIGTIVSALIIYFSFNYNNPTIKGICTLSEKTDCNYILNSKASKVFEFLSWSEIGLLYFTTTFVLIIFAETAHNPRYYSLIWILNIMCLPYTVYSVYYQLVTVKKICTLCMFIQFIIWLEFLIGQLFFDKQLNLSVSELYTFLFIGCFIAVVWFTIKPLVESYYKLPLLNRELKNFKLNVGLFNSLLATSKSLVYPSDVDFITFGNKNAPLNITIFTNPLCGPCGVVHHKLEKLIVEYGENLSVTEIFTVSDNPQDNRRLLAAHMIQLFRQKSSKEALEAYHCWYDDDKKDINTWLNSFSIDGNPIEENVILLNKYASITKYLEIKSTPTIAINGRQLPEVYSIDDLIELVPYLF